MFDKIDIIDNFLTEQDFRELLFIKLKVKISYMQFILQQVLINSHL